MLDRRLRHLSRSEDELQVLEHAAARLCRHESPYRTFGSDEQFRVQAQAIRDATVSTRAYERLPGSLPKPEQ
jgi:hypothetical protein